MAKLNDVVVGFAHVWMRTVDAPELQKRKIFYIESLCVEEALRSHGIGTQMAAELRLLARAFGCSDLQLGVYPQNDAAVSFWQKCGFMIQSINMQCKA